MSLRPSLGSWHGALRAWGWLVRSGAMPCKAAVALLAVSWLGASLAVADEPRVLVSLDHGWRFQQSASVTGAEGRTFDDSAWSAVEVPHTWNRIGNEGIERSPLSNNVQGMGWYRLRFATPPGAAPAAAAGQKKASRFFLQFDGVGAIADVWLNGHYLGKHAGAFSRFRFDATAAIDPSGDNVLVVKADNSRPQPGSTTAAVIPLSGDFFVFGGIYRSVALVVTRSAHVDMLDYGGPGVYAHAVSIDPAAAVVQVASRVVNDGPKPAKVSVETVIEDADGKVVASTEPAAPLTLTAKVVVTSATLRIPQPRLWQGVKDPYLYRTVVTLRSPRGEILDRVTQPLGLRTLAFDPDKGFFLNGEHLSLHGASMHQDRPVKGWAISRADQEQDFDILSDMGGNAVRLAHYQHDQRSYDLADERGIIAWAEIPLVNQVSFDGAPASEAFAANATRQLLELIRQNYNHPSIAVWSIANEIDLRATQSGGVSKPLSLLESLNRLAKSEDPGRFTTLADCCEVGLPPHTGSDIANIAPRDSIVGVTDVVAYNRYFGWYTGKFSDFGVMLDAAHARHARLPLAISEYGAGAALTQHSDDPAGGPLNPHGRPHPEEMQNLYHEASWSALRARPYLWGVFIWNLFDFSSDSRNEGDLTDINEKGLVSYDRTVAKDAFYFYRANWSTQPTLHLVGRRYTDRAYAVLDVKAYSNATQAHLSLNGQEQGVTSCAEGVCLWRGIHLAQGANELRATADIGGVETSDTLRWTFAGSPAVVRIKAGDISGYVARDNERYGSDMYFVGGEGKGIDPPDTPVGERSAVTGAVDARLCDSYREGEFAYHIPVPDGRRYRITARFVEPTATTTGERLFDVDVNGKRALNEFDVFAAAGGKLKSVERTFDGTAKDGYLVITFRPSRGRALV
ncbi:MAG TPA: glycoside hydrolase family 2 TIM barrel-domain containing protein, partial [Steroidobacteraceae bacterium]|nr:glycoside hydrolase family 2 TIM barrel-domain containing protein [Steroidobacteraceae bacterium]